ncbi:MAG: NrdG: anaerobic ribonucleoside-triphosphate reductase activating protein [Firmicutes bacterium]|nr:NrdG: anaerobic ribonucleoside-triphosphate reductase activating protein [Bacillota bacterium]
MEIRIAGTVKESVVDGPGIRYVIFTQGCPHRCSGCHNPKTHDPAEGLVTTTGELYAEIAAAKLIRGVTFSGGEPFIQPEPLAALAAKIKELGLNLVTYSGYTFEELLVMAEDNPAIHTLLRHTDLLVDGPFKAEQRDIGLAFRGSRNQRLIDVKTSLALGHITPWPVVEGQNAD